MLRLGCLFATLTVAAVAVAGPAGAAEERPVDITMAGSMQAGALVIDELVVTGSGVGRGSAFVVAAGEVVSAPVAFVVDAPGRPYHGATMTVRLEAFSDLRGVIDLESGTVTAAVDIRLLLGTPGFFSDCPIGPAPLALDSRLPGGAPYDTTTGRVTLIGDEFGLPVVEPAVAECFGFHGDVDVALGLPTEPGDAQVTFELSTDPVITQPEPEPTTTSTSTTATTTTTTVATTTPSSPSTTRAEVTTTAAPRVAAPAQPRPASPARRGAPPAAPATPSSKPATTTTTTEVVTLLLPGTTEPPAVIQPAAPPASSNRPRTIEPIAEASAEDTPRRVGMLLGSAVILAAVLALLRSEVRTSRWARRRRYAHSHRRY